MYKNEKELHWNTRIPENGKAYGRGFTICGTIDDDDIDRSDIDTKIKNHFFDKIIYGSCTRCLDYLDLTIKYYDKSDILFVDGEDGQNIKHELLQYGTYFKRELVSKDLGKVRPIHFAIPEHHILNSVPNKTKDYGTIIPGDISTYIYDNQVDYYDDYKESYFGITFKKGGWDCLRHYEILANGCVPYFPDLHNCPPYTMVNFPKKLVLDCNLKAQIGKLTSDEYNLYAKLLLQYSKINLTTKKLFEYIMRTRTLKDTYIFICSYNRLDPLQKLVNALTSRGYNNIVILDNRSTYQPLLDWYKTLTESITVYTCAQNYGPEALDCVRNYEPEFQDKFNHIVLNEFHVYTDSDVVPIEDVPETFIDDMVELCIKYNIPKMGLSLKIDDLPDHFQLKDKVINHEKSFFEREYIDDDKCRLYKAPVDTTFAVNAPGIPCGYNDFAYRAAGDYFARHMPWYYDTFNLSEEETYYLANIEGPRPHWSNILKTLISDHVNSNT